MWYRKQCIDLKILLIRKQRRGIWASSDEWKICSVILYCTIQGKTRIVFFNNFSVQCKVHCVISDIWMVSLSRVNNVSRWKIHYVSHFHGPRCFPLVIFWVNENELPKRILCTNRGGQRGRGRSKSRWIDGVEEDVSKLGCRNWLTAAQDRSRWRHLLEEAKAHLGLYSRWLWYIMSVGLCR